MDRIGYVILYVPDLDASIAFYRDVVGLPYRFTDASQLAALGTTVLSGPADRPWGHRTVHIADPDGFVVEFAQEIPRQREPGPLVTRVRNLTVAKVDSDSWCAGAPSARRDS